MATADANRRGHLMFLFRIALALCVLSLLVDWCLLTDRARNKGLPMEAWRLVPLILTAAVFATLGKRFLNSVSGLFLGGIGGAFGTLDTHAGPYGGIAGLLVGAIVILLPVMHKPKPNAGRSQPLLEAYHRT